MTKVLRVSIVAVLTVLVVGVLGLAYSFVGSLGYPLVGVEVTTNATGHVFRFKNCTNEKTLQITSVELLRDEGGKMVTECSLWFRVPSASLNRPLVPGDEWTYPDVPAGYNLTGECAPLVSGRAYRVAAGGPMRQFTVRGDGAVITQGPICQ